PFRNGCQRRRVTQMIPDHVMASRIDEFQVRIQVDAQDLLVRVAVVVGAVIDTLLEQAVTIPLLTAPVAIGAGAISGQGESAIPGLRAEFSQRDIPRGLDRLEMSRS